jgi:hypothetical protein
MLYMCWYTLIDEYRYDELVCNAAKALIKRRNEWFQCVSSATTLGIRLIFYKGFCYCGRQDFRVWYLPDLWWRQAGGERRTLDATFTKPTNKSEVRCSIKSTSKKSMASPMLEKQDYGCDDAGKEKVGLLRVRKTLTMTIRLLILDLLAVVIIFRQMLISQSVIGPDSENVSPSHFGLASSSLHRIPYGSRFQCTNLSVPLNHLNHSDKRTASIAITRYLSSVQDS